MSNILKDSRAEISLQLGTIGEGLIYTHIPQRPNPPCFVISPGSPYIEEGETLEKASRRELLEETGLVFKKYKLLKNYIVSGSYMFGELNFIQIQDIEKVSDAISKDIENPEHIWITKEQVKKALTGNDFKALTYATAAMTWLLYNEEN